MPFVPVPNSALVEIRMELDDQQVENTLWFEAAAPPTEANLLVLATAVQDWWVGNISAIVSNALVLREVTATSMHSATDPQVSLVPASLVTGAQTAGALPNSNALTVSFRTALRGRSFRGRNYIVGLCENQVALNTVDPTTVTSIVNAYNALLIAAEDTDYLWIVASRFSGVDGAGKPIPRAAGVTTPVTTVIVVDDTIDSQRRRLPGRGK